VGYTYIIYIERGSYLHVVDLGVSVTAVGGAGPWPLHEAPRRHARVARLTGARVHPTQQPCTVNKLSQVSLTGSEAELKGKETNGPKQS
jgi:hypothetical protein